MDWDKLRIFHAAAEAGSFTHAGETPEHEPNPRSAARSAPLKPTCACRCFIAMPAVSSRPNRANCSTEPPMRW